MMSQLRFFIDLQNSIPIDRVRAKAIDISAKKDVDINRM